MQPAVVFGAEKPEWCVMDLPGGRFIVAAEGPQAEALLKDVVDIFVKAWSKMTEAYDEKPK